MDEKAKIHLLESDETEPKVRLAAGKRYEGFATSIVGHDLKAIAEEAKEPRQRAPRLCGSRSTCLAIVETAEIE